jgi:type II secretory pathway predicted ATPase ExeA
VIHPLGLEENREMIGFRLRQAGYTGAGLFSDDAIRSLYEYTRGYPRKLALVCHSALESLVMQERTTVDEAVVRDVIAKDLRPIAEESGGTTDVFQPGVES